MRILLLTLTTLVVVFFALFASEASAHHPVISSIASSIAGKPVVVKCETDNVAWANQIAYVFPASHPDRIYGYTRLVENVIYLSPRVCLPLDQALDFGYKDTGLIPLALSLSTLAHESYHQKGIVNEAQTECLANKRVRSLATQYLRVPATVTTRKIVYVYKTIKGLRIRVPVVKNVVSTNPELGRLDYWVSRWHSVKPIEYKGGVC